LSWYFSDVIIFEYLDQYVKNKKIDPSGNKSHLLTPEKSTIEERYNHHSANKFYLDVLKELEKTPLELEGKKTTV